MTSQVSNSNQQQSQRVKILEDASTATAHRERYVSYTCIFNFVVDSIMV